MSRALSNDMKNAIEANVIRPVLLCEINTAGGYVRVWTGVGNLVFDGNTYLGVGDFGGVSEIKETSDLQANGAKFSLSGISEEYVSLAMQDVRQGYSAKLYFGAVDENNSLIVDPYLLFQGITDVPQIEDDANDSVISISAENRLIDLEKSEVRRFTPEDQAIDYPDDRGFDYVAALQEKEIRFG
jgi:hypothetical protein